MPLYLISRLSLRSLDRRRRTQTFCLRDLRRQKLQQLRDNINYLLSAHCLRVSVAEIFNRLSHTTGTTAYSSNLGKISRCCSF